MRCSRALRRRCRFGRAGPLRSKPTQYADAKKAIFSTVADEGKRTCQLDDDEIRSMFQETFNYLEQVFRNPSVRTIAHEFARHLKDSRRLSHYEVKQLLGMISED